MDIKNISIIGFHGFKDKGLYFLGNKVDRNEFIDFLWLIKESGYNFYTDIDILNNKINSKGVIIFFDDAEESLNFLITSNSIPKDFKGILFVIGNYIGEYFLWDVIGKKRKSLDYETIKEFISRGYSIGSHSLTHKPLSYLEYSQLEKELKDSKYILEKKFNVDVISFSPPFGVIDKFSLNIAKNYYRFIFSINSNLGIRDNNLLIANTGIIFDNKYTLYYKILKKNRLINFFNSLNEKLYLQFSKGSVLLKRFGLL